MRARNVGEICGAKWTICRRQRWAKALGESQPAWGGHTRSAEQRSGGSEGQGRRGLWLGNWGLSRDPTVKTSQNSKAGRLGACHAHFETIGTGIFAPTQPESW